MPCLMSRLTFAFLHDVSKCMYDTDGVCYYDARSLFWSTQSSCTAVHLEASQGVGEILLLFTLRGYITVNMTILGVC